MISPCQCPEPRGAFWCPRHQREKLPLSWQACQDVRYRALWDDQVAAGVQPAGPTEQIVGAARAAWSWLASGCKIVPDEVAAARRAICDACPHWREGRCGICGCGGIKHHLPSECCPVGKWYEHVSTPLIRRWAVGIVTSPVLRIPRGTPADQIAERAEVIGTRQSIADTVRTTRRAGWFAPVVYAEPGSWVPDGVEVVWRPRRLGAWRNHHQAVQDLLGRDPAAEAVLLLEDDVFVAPGTRGWLETVGWPADDCGILSLYRHSGRHRGPDKTWVGTDEVCDPADDRGYQRVRPDAEIWGSCAIVLRRDHAAALAADPAVSNLDGESPNLCDIRLRRWVRSRELSYWLAKPSRVQHRQDVPSAIGHSVGGPEMRADDYPGGFVP